jgi:hypothetical protein
LLRKTADSHTNHSLKARRKAIRTPSRASKAISSPRPARNPASLPRPRSVSAPEPQELPVCSRALPSLPLLYLVVTGYFGYFEQGFHFVAPPSGFHRPLKMEQRRIQKEKYGKVAHQRVRNPIQQGVPNTSYIGDTIPCLPQTANQLLYDSFSQYLIRIADDCLANLTKTVLCAILWKIRLICSVLQLTIEQIYLEIYWRVKW